MGSEGQDVLYGALQSFLGLCGVLWVPWGSVGLSVEAPWSATGLSPTSCAPQLVFAVTMDVPHEAELGDAVQVVALASRWVAPQRHTVPPRGSG